MPIVAVHLYHHDMAVQAIAGMLGCLFGDCLCRAAVQHALKAASDIMEPHAEQIRKDLAESQYLHTGGMPFPVAGSTPSHA